MKYIKNISIIFLIMISIIIISSLIITLLNYFNILNKNTISILKIFIIIITYLIGGILIGKKSNKKGWLEGLKFSLIISIIFIIFNLIFIKHFDLKLIYYYSILIISGILGSMIGINKKI